MTRPEVYTGRPMTARHPRTKQQKSWNATLSGRFGSNVTPLPHTRTEGTSTRVNGWPFLESSIRVCSSRANGEESIEEISDGFTAHHWILKLRELVIDEYAATRKRPWLRSNGSDSLMIETTTSKPITHIESTAYRKLRQPTSGEPGIAAPCLFSVSC